MIWKRLRKSTDEEEEQFGRMMEEEKVGWKGVVAMLISSFFVLILPAILAVTAFAALAIWVLSIMS